MKNLKFLKSSKMILFTDKENISKFEKIDNILDEIRKKYKLDVDLVNIFTTVSKYAKFDQVKFEININSNDNDANIVAPLEWFLMKLGNFPINKKILEYRNNEIK